MYVIYEWISRFSLLMSMIITRLDLNASTKSNKQTREFFTSDSGTTRTIMKQNKYIYNIKNIKIIVNKISDLA